MSLKIIDIVKIYNELVQDANYYERDGAEEKLDKFLDVTVFGHTTNEDYFLYLLRKEFLGEDK